MWTIMYEGKRDSPLVERDQCIFRSRKCLSHTLRDIQYEV